MPELPDLLYIRDYLERSLVGTTVAALEVKQPVLLRNTLDEDPSWLLQGHALTAVLQRGPFLTLRFEPPLELIVNLMLAGRLQHQHAGEHAAGHLCLTLAFSDGSRLNLCDDQKMAKVYLVRPGRYGFVPNYEQQGIDILTDAFSRERFRELAALHRRKQVRVFINTHSLLSAIGNAYADEILFEARIHPKTFVGTLSSEQVDILYSSIRIVMAWGMAEVRKANQPIQVKVRDHLKVRNRHGEHCPRCGTTIRREGVRGHDVFFCPTCQPASRNLFIDWNRAPRN